MAEMGKYCKAYLAESFAGYDGWNPDLSQLRQETDDGDEAAAQPRTELEPGDILYLQETYVVTDGIYLDENIVFNDVTDAWKSFCTDTLKFEIPVYEPIEIPHAAEDGDAEAAGEAAS